MMNKRLFLSLALFVSSAHVFASEAPVVQASGSWYDYVSRFVPTISVPSTTQVTEFATNNKTALYTVGAVALIAGAYAAYKYVATPCEKIK